MQRHKGALIILYARTCLYTVLDETWQSFVKENSKVLITIYYAGCPNCEVIRKELTECAKAAREQNIAVKIAVVDGEQYGSTIHRLWTKDMGTPTIFWYENGIKQFEYIKSRAAEELIKFIKNPKKPQEKKSYPDWSMQESADDIYFLDARGFDSFVKDQEHMMVVFFSPGCNACFNIRSQYEEAATRLDDIRSDVTMAAVNFAKARELSARFNVVSYPYFAYFKEGRFKFQYKGKPLADDIVEFMKNPKPPAEPDISENIPAEPESNVTSLTEETFNKFMKTHSNVLVMFSTPWCGHCRHFKPKYEKAADALKADGSLGKLASVNGNNEKNLLKEYNVYGFPTLLHFQNGENKDKYKGERTMESVVRFMKNATNETTLSEHPKPKTTDIIMKTKPQQVTALNSTTFEKFINSSEQVFIMFYAPWCGACKTSKDAFFQAAIEVYEELDYFKLAVINADKLSSLMKKYNLTGFPSFLFFKDGRFITKYRGTTDKKSFIGFLNDPPEEKEETEQKPSSSSSQQWISEVGKVEHPNINNFEQFVRKYTHVLVFFYINACEICLNQMKPEYTKAAEILRKERPAVRLAAVNGAWESKLMQQFGVDGFPTILYFSKGKKQYVYKGDWKTGSLVKFMKNPKEELAKKQKPTSWQDIKGVMFGGVVHLGNKTFDQFIAKQKHALILFHSLYFSRCIIAQEQFRISAMTFARETNVGFGAVDCHRQPEQGLVCYHLDVKKFPSYKYYLNGKLSKDLEFARTEEITDFMLAKIEQQKSREEL
nr:protein disulfide-isomerase A5-like [Ciona intestinalis]|eukprot:XP_009858978.2 protein disulfide-isomerase A5-like [Ciona intestinalis]